MPVVTTPVGAEGIPDIGEAAIISSDPKEFAAQTVKLYQDNGRLKELAVQAQKLIKAHFSMDAVWVQEYPSSSRVQEAAEQLD